MMIIIIYQAIYIYMGIGQSCQSLLFPGLVFPGTSSLETMVGSHSDHGAFRFQVSQQNQSIEIWSCGHGYWWLMVIDGDY